MKKMLTILGSLMILTSAATTVVACGVPMAGENLDGINKDQISLAKIPTQHLDIKKAYWANVEIKIEELIQSLDPKTENAQLNVDYNIDYRPKDLDEDSLPIKPMTVNVEAIPETGMLKDNFKFVIQKNIQDELNDIPNHGNKETGQDARDQIDDIIHEYFPDKDPNDFYDYEEDEDGSWTIKSKDDSELEFGHDYNLISPVDISKITLDAFEMSSSTKQMIESAVDNAVQALVKENNVHPVLGTDYEIVGLEYDINNLPTSFGRFTVHSLDKDKVIGSFEIRIIKNYRLNDYPDHGTEADGEDILNDIINEIKKENPGSEEGKDYTIDRGKDGSWTINPAPDGDLKFKGPNGEDGFHYTTDPQFDLGTIPEGDLLVLDLDNYGLEQRKLTKTDIEVEIKKLLESKGATGAEVGIDYTIGSFDYNAQNQPEHVGEITVKSIPKGKLTGSFVVKLKKTLDLSEYQVDNWPHDWLTVKPEIIKEIEKWNPAAISSPNTYYTIEPTKEKDGWIVKSTQKSLLKLVGKDNQDFVYNFGPINLNDLDFNVELKESTSETEIKNKINEAIQKKIVDRHVELPSNLTELYKLAKPIAKNQTNLYVGDVVVEPSLAGSTAFTGSFTVHLTKNLSTELNQLDKQGTEQESKDTKQQAIDLINKWMQGAIEGTDYKFSPLSGKEGWNLHLINSATGLSFNDISFAIDPKPNLGDLNAEFILDIDNVDGLDTKLTKQYLEDLVFEKISRLIADIGSQYELKKEDYQIKYPYDDLFVNDLPTAVGKIDVSVVNTDVLTGRLTINLVKNLTFENYPNNSVITSQSWPEAEVYIKKEISKWDRNAFNNNYADYLIPNVDAKGPWIVQSKPTANLKFNYKYETNKLVDLSTLNLSLELAEFGLGQAAIEREINQLIQTEVDRQLNSVMGSKTVKQGIDYVIDPINYQGSVVHEVGTFKVRAKSGTTLVFGEFNLHLTKKLDFSRNPKTGWPDQGQTVQDKIIKEIKDWKPNAVAGIDYKITGGKKNWTISAGENSNLIFEDFTFNSDQPMKIDGIQINSIDLDSDSLRFEANLINEINRQIGTLFNASNLPSDMLNNHYSISGIVFDKDGKASHVGTLTVKANNNDDYLAGSFTIKFTKKINFDHLDKHGTLTHGQDVRQQINDELKKWIPNGANPEDYYHFENTENGGFKITTPDSDISFSFEYTVDGPIVLDHELDLSVKLDDDKMSKNKIETLVQDQIETRNKTNHWEIKLGRDYKINFGTVEFNESGIPFKIGKVTVEVLNNELLTGSFTIKVGKDFVLNEDDYPKNGSKEEGKLIEDQIKDEINKYLPDGANPDDYYDVKENEDGSFTIKGKENDNGNIDIDFTYTVLSDLATSGIQIDIQVHDDMTKVRALINSEINNWLHDVEKRSGTAVEGIDYEVLHDSDDTTNNIEVRAIKGSKLLRNSFIINVHKKDFTKLNLDGIKLNMTEAEVNDIVIEAIKNLFTGDNAVTPIISVDDFHVEKAVVDGKVTYTITPLNTVFYENSKIYDLDKIDFSNQFGEDFEIPNVINTNEAIDAAIQTYFDQMSALNGIRVLKNKDYNVARIGDNVSNTVRVTVSAIKTSELLQGKYEFSLAKYLLNQEEDLKGLAVPKVNDNIHEFMTKVVNEINKKFPTASRKVELTDFENGEADGLIQPGNLTLQASSTSKLITGKYVFNIANPTPLPPSDELNKYEVDASVTDSVSSVKLAIEQWVNKVFPNARFGIDYDIYSNQGDALDGKTPAPDWYKVDPDSADANDNFVRTIRYFKLVPNKNSNYIKGDDVLFKIKPFDLRTLKDASFKTNIKLGDKQATVKEQSYITFSHLLLDLKIFENNDYALKVISGMSFKDDLGFTQGGEPGANLRVTFTASPTSTVNRFFGGSVIFAPILAD